MFVVKKKSLLSRRNLLIAAGTLIVVAGIVFVLERKGVINLYTKEIPTDTDATTTSKAPSAQSDFNEGDDREAGSTIREGGGTASVVDNSGSIADSVDRSNPSVSATGEITIFSPTSNTLVDDQLYIAGTSTLASVSYRVVDSISGVISLGELSVVNGQFSGTLKIETDASEGRLDIFGAQNDGNEFSNLAIPLRFR